MKILILYDTAATGNPGTNWLSLLLENIDSSLSVEVEALDHNDFFPCTGCFGCWIKTPGTCVITKDTANGLSQSYMRADKVILLSKVTYGCCSPDTKGFLDRSLSLLSPFFTMSQGKMHHRKRYAHYPDLLALGYGDMTPAEEQTFMALFHRNALNLYPRNHRVLTIAHENKMKEVAKDIAIFLEER